MSTHSERSNIDTSRHTVDLIQSTIVIHEEDAPELNPVAGIPAKRPIRRCISVPETLYDIRSVLRIRTLDESIHSTYGESDGGSRGSRGNIKFKNVGIREYARTVGDNPSCSSGPPVSIGWEYAAVAEVTLQEYEDTRPPRRSHFEMVLPKKVRQDMLRKEWGVPQTKIAESVRRNVQCKNQRKATVNNLGKATKIEEMLESASRKVKRLLRCEPSVSAQVVKLEEKTNEAQRRRSQLALEKFLLAESESRESTLPNPDDSTNVTKGTTEKSKVSKRRSGSS